MPYTIVLYVWRKPGTTPAAFKEYYETTHVPLIRSLAGDLFPKSHTRYYIERTPTANASSDPSNAAHPATVLVGDQSAFDYDSYAELVFSDKEAFQKFFARIREPEAAKKLADDELNFADVPKMIAVAVDQTSVTAY